MIRSAIILWLSSFAGLIAEDHSDLLRFTNGDQLHGAFVGMKEGPQAIWRRNDLEASVDFKTSNIRHIVLHGGRPAKALESLSNLSLVNGDRIPGVITAIDDETITMESACAGVLHIPRKQIAVLSPNPLGGRVYYHGPFSEDDWKMTNSEFPTGLPQAASADQKEHGHKTHPDGESENDNLGRWAFSGSAWYWQDKRSGTALIHENGMPDRAVLSFNLAWKNRLNVAIGFHADFAHAKEKADNKELIHRDAPELARIFGNSYILQLSSNYLMLFRSSITPDGKSSLERIQMNSNSLRLGDTGTVKLEIRSNRINGGISLFANDQFIAQWSEGDLIGRDDESFAGKGSGFGFVVEGNDSPVRISDMIITEWNGMPDSARSLQVNDQDVVLMANGTDRYAGKIGKLDNDGKIQFEGKHGTFRFPLEDVAEIHFARAQLATTPNTPADNTIIRFSPIGSISGRPVSGSENKLNVVSPIIGEMNISLDSAVMLDFNASNQFIDDWDTDF